MASHTTICGSERRRLSKTLLIFLAEELTWPVDILFADAFMQALGLHISRISGGRFLSV